MKNKKDLELYISQAIAYKDLLKKTNLTGKNSIKIKSVDQKIKQAVYMLRLIS